MGGVSLSIIANFVIENIEEGVFVIKSIDTKEILESAGVFSNLIAANITAGAVETIAFTTDSFLAFQGTVDNLLINNGLVSPLAQIDEVKTALISPLPDKTDVTIQIGSKDATTSGKLVIENPEGAEVASIDEYGNATFSGEISSISVKTNELIAGKIYADEIVARNGYFSELASETSSSVTLEQIEELLKKAQEDQILLESADNWDVNTATSSANLDNLAATNLYVTEAAAINSLSVSSSIAVGTDLIIASEIDKITNQPVNSINTLIAPLKIQSLALAPVEIMAGLVRIDTNGDVTIAGNLYVAGKIESSGLTLRTSDQSTVDVDNLLSLIDKQGNQVSSINASGAAQFGDITAEKFIIASPDTTNPPEIVNGEIVTNATAGKATLPKGTAEITIRNANITDYTLVYVTPTSSTQNRVLYVKSKANGYFTVGFTDALSEAVEFNWWIVDIVNK